MLITENSPKLREMKFSLIAKRLSNDLQAHTHWVQILNEAFCISHSANTLGKCIHLDSPSLTEFVNLWYGNQSKRKTFLIQIS